MKPAILIVPLIVVLSANCEIHCILQVVHLVHIIISLPEQVGVQITIFAVLNDHQQLL
jgi:hypothetical protein